MQKHHLRFRHIHLDFHTSPHIPGVGEKFDKKQWQEALKVGHVDSINLFAKCHHGWSYHETKVGRMHPHLNFDLLRAQYDATKEIGINAAVYISAGLDEVMAEEHPEWREIGKEGAYIGWTGPITNAGFKTLCFNTPYMEYLLEQTREVVELFPECDGIWSDIILQSECCCKWCREYMDEHGLVLEKDEDRKACAQGALNRYYKEFSNAVWDIVPSMPIFHNSGHVSKNRRDLLQWFTHLELESLPTGGWGYDHYPMSAKYAKTTGLDFLGMTGKFHTWWGEFGGFKHPNALRYECGQMLAFGSKCCVGDQLHPGGEMDMSTYGLIGKAYKEVREKEPWCDNVENIADIAILSSEAEAENKDPDTGAGRLLLECQFLFDIIDRHTAFDKYKMLILPDVIEVDEDLKSKLHAFLAKGGKLLVTGKSGVAKGGNGFAVDTGAEYIGESPHQPDYLEGGSALAPSYVNTPLVMQLRSQQVKPITGEVIAHIRNPYFNRTWRHFCSHQHAPAADLSEYPGAIRKGNILYLAHPIFSIYNAVGGVAYKEYIANAVNMLLADDKSMHTNLPSPASASVTHQPEEKRYILHLLYANIMARGANTVLSPESYVIGSSRVEVIEELLPLRDIKASVKLPVDVKKVTLEPQGKEIPFKQTENGAEIEVDEFTCHQMVVLHY